MLGIPDPRATRLSRRSALKAAALATGAILAPAGLAEAARTAPNPAPLGAASWQTEIKRGGNLVAAMPALDRLDPHTSSVNLQYQFSTLYDSLTYLDLDESTNQTRLVGALAESWQAAPDGRSITFELRKGVKFHDGSDWTAEVARWNFLRLRDDPKSTSKELFADIDDIQADGATTLKISFKSPNVIFPIMVSEAGSLGRARMISKAAFEQLGADEFAMKPSGTGAFRFTSWQKDDRLVVDKNPDYWQTGDDGKALPYLDRITFREMVDEPTVIAEMRAGTIHYFNNQLAAASGAALARDPAFDVYYWKEGPDYFMVGCNAKEGPFAQSRELRLAVAHAINREEVVKALSPGIGAPASQFVESGFLGHNPDLVYPFDLDRAKALMAQAGYANGLSIKMLTWNREAWKRRAEVYQQQLERIGIKSEISALEGLDWRATTKSNQGYDLALWGETARADPDLMSRFMTTAGQGNWMNFDLPEVDKLFMEGRAALDNGQRHEIYQRATKLFFEAAYVIPIYGETSPRAKLKQMRWQKRQFLFHTPITWWLSS